jgi:chemotaxis signal transduction protein
MRFAAQPATAAGRSEQMILFRIGQQVFALSASSVQEIRSTDAFSGLSSPVDDPSLRKVSFVPRRGRPPLYIVHGGMHFGLSLPQGALIFLLRNRRSALRVDSIERMAAFSRLMALPSAFCGEERNWYRGFVVLDDGIVPVVNPEGLLRQDELELLDALTAVAPPVPEHLLEETLGPQ